MSIQHCAGESYRALISSQLHDLSMHFTEILFFPLSKVGAINIMQVHFLYVLINIFLHFDLLLKLINTLSSHCKHSVKSLLFVLYIIVVEKSQEI